jgi:hypothetical protein
MRVETGLTTQRKLLAPGLASKGCTWNLTTTARTELHLQHGPSGGKGAAIVTTIWKPGHAQANSSRNHAWAAEDPYTEQLRPKPI